MGVPHSGWFRIENPIKKDELGVPLFLEPPIYINVPSKSMWKPWEYRVHM